MGNTSTAEYIAGEMIATIIHDSDLLDMDKEKVAHVRAKLAEKLAEPLCKEGAALFTKEFIEDFCIGEDTDVQSILAAHPSLQPAHDMLDEFFEEGVAATGHDTTKGEGVTAEERQKPDERKQLVKPVQLVGAMCGETADGKYLIAVNDVAGRPCLCVHRCDTTASGVKMSDMDDGTLVTYITAEQLLEAALAITKLKS